MSLTAGWKVELGVGDPANIPGTGVYDTATYAGIDFQGPWIFDSLFSHGKFFVAGTLLTINVIDDLGADRTAEMDAAPVTTTMELVGTVHRSTWLTVRHTTGAGVRNYQVSYVAGDTVINILGQQVPIFDDGEAVDIRWLETVPVYGSDNEFGYLTDVTNVVESISTRRGRDRYTSRFRTGVATVVFDDTSGVFTPPSGVATSLGFLPLRPGRAVRISQGNGVVFSGFVDSFDTKATRDGDIRSVVKCSDSFAGFNRNTLPAVAVEGSGEDTFTRMRRLLDHFLGEGRSLSTFGTAVMTMQSTTMGQSLLTELQVTADSEGGGCWIDVNGNVAASGFSYFSDKALEPPSWTVGGVSIPITASDSAWELARIINEAHMSRSGGTEQVRVNVESQGVYGRRTHTRLDLHNDADDQVAVLAQRLVDFAGIDRQRITELQFMPEPGTATEMMCVAATFGDVFRVTIDTIWGWSYTVLTALYGIEHTVTDEVWLCTLRTDDTEFEPVRFAFERASFDNDSFS